MSVRATHKKGGKNEAQKTDSGLKKKKTQRDSDADKGKKRGWRKKNTHTRRERERGRGGDVGTNTKKLPKTHEDRGVCFLCLCVRTLPPR